MNDSTDDLNAIETNDSAKGEAEVLESAAGTVSLTAETEDDVEIRPTDIVFDCPHCGHNLCIDYRGAGLQTNCVECGAAVLVPIPDGMKIDDLDLNPGELLTQLFQTRRMLQEARDKIAEMEDTINDLKLRRSELEKSRLATLHRCAELAGMSQGVQKLQNEAMAVMGRITALIAEEQQH
ncbi:MAG: hypothetical protein J6U40_03840 [Kiritimatiellae bacterium]|nr:hypothetical protein [Kiritimatiellia bacterium]MBP5227698.1 hypothetical protein [Kiritimatiellia bacterium]